MNCGVFYSVSGGVCVVKMVGEVQHDLSRSFGCFSQKIDEGGFNAIVIDLTETTHLDSTALGVIAHLCLKKVSPAGEKNAKIYSTNQKVNECMRTVGFFSLFDIVESSYFESATLSSVPACKCSQETAENVVLEAHKTLCCLSRDNERTFSDIVELIENGRSLESILAN